MQAGLLVVQAAGEGEKAIDGGGLAGGGIRLGFQISIGVVHAVVDDRGYAGLGVVLGQVADGAEIVGQGPDDPAGRGEIVAALTPGPSPDQPSVGARGGE